jgi:hypothetical protein
LIGNVLTWRDKATLETRRDKRKKEKKRKKKKKRNQYPVLVSIIN